MKIIAAINSDQFIVEASGNELAQVMGIGSTYQLKDGQKLAVGREVKLSDLWQALQVSRSRKDEVAELANALRKIAGKVDTINQALAAPIVEVKS